MSERIPGHTHGKFRHTKSQVNRGLVRPLPADHGCPDCNKRGLDVSVKITSKSATCTSCGAKFSLEEYYNYIEQLEEEKTHDKHGD